MVYRPPKHKLAPGTRPSRPSVDPLTGAASPADDSDLNLQGDDRNLVGVDESYSGGDYEDRLWLFWQRNNKNILRAVVVVCVGLIAWQSWNLYQRHEISSLQAEYQAATGPDTLLAFSQAHADNTLGKLALIEAADAFYQAGKFKEAADAYSKAASVWAGDEKAQRARLGAAMALVGSGNIADAKQRLESLYNDSTIDNIRAETAFYSGVLYAQGGDVDNANKWIERAKNFTGSSAAWATQAKTFGDILPLLSDIKLVSGDYKPSLDSSIAPAANLPGTAKPAASATTAAPAKPAATAAPDSTTSLAAPFDLSGQKK